MQKWISCSAFIFAELGLNVVKQMSIGLRYLYKYLTTQPFKKKSYLKILEKLRISKIFCFSKEYDFEGKRCPPPQLLSY